MKLSIERATGTDFAEFESWRYEPPYDFYNGDAEPVLNPERFYTARDESGEIVGFYYFEARGDALYYGLGLRPDFTGRGLGLEFVQIGLEHGRELLRARRATLSVAAFNARARVVYERAGFVVSGRHMRSFEKWGNVEFIDMEER